MNNSKQIVLTGDRPSGPLHIGHYFGSMTNRKELSEEYQTYIMQADVQALTDNWDEPEKVRKNIIEVVLDNLSMDLNMQNTTIFVQSQIPQIAELTVFYSNLVTINRLKRNPTIKTEIAQKTDKFGKEGQSVTFGFLGYPISQAADITFLGAELIPVGVDQLPIIEQVIEIVEKFNRIYKTDTLTKPKAILTEGKRILGLDGRKMSKSLNNSIYLKDSEEETIDKLKRAKTDSEDGFSYNTELRPEISNLILLYSLSKGISIQETLNDLKGLNYSKFKTELASSINKHLKPIRERRKELENNIKSIHEMLAQNRQKVIGLAESKMQKIRQAMQIDYNF